MVQDACTFMRRELHAQMEGKTIAMQNGAATWESYQKLVGELAQIKWCLGLVDDLEERAKRTANM